MFSGWSAKARAGGQADGSEDVGAVGGDSIPKMLGHERERRAAAKRCHLCVAGPGRGY